MCVIVFRLAHESTSVHTLMRAQTLTFKYARLNMHTYPYHAHTSAPHSHALIAFFRSRFSMPFVSIEVGEETVAQAQKRQTLEAQNKERERVGKEAAKRKK